MKAIVCRRCRHSFPAPDGVVPNHHADGSLCASAKCAWQRCQPGMGRRSRLPGVKK